MSTSSLSASRRNSRVSVTRSHTFNNPDNVNANTMKISSDKIKSNENVTCQSTPELSCSNERERNQAIVNIEETCGLSTNGTILTGTSLTGLTPTSNGAIDDKNEVCTCSFLFSYCFIKTYYEEKNYQIEDRKVSAFASFSLLSSHIHLMSISKDNTTYT